MSRFDSPVQVVGLFLIASIVSVGLIFFINAEAEAETRRAAATLAGNGIAQPQEKSRQEEDTFISIEESSRSHYIGPRAKPPHISLLNYLESGIGRLLGGGRREKRSLRDDGGSSLPPSPSRKKHSAEPGVLGGSSLAVPDANFERLVQESGVKMSFSSDAHKIRHARKKLDEKGLDGVLRMIFDTNSIREEEAAPTASSIAPIPPPPPALEFPNFRGANEEDMDFDEGGGDFPPNHRRKSVEETTWKHQPTHQHQKQILDEESKLQRKEGMEDETKKIKDEYLDYNIEPPVGLSTSTLGAILTGADAEDDEMEASGGGDYGGVQWIYSNPNHPNFSHVLHGTTGISRTSGDGDYGIGTATTVGNHGHGSKKSKAAAVLKENLDVCYKTDDVLVIIAITCTLNFTFVLVIWACVRWCSVAGMKDLKEFQHLDCEGGGDSTVFPQDPVDSCWVPGIHRSQRNPGRGGGGPTRLTSTSLYSFRPDAVPQHLLRRSYSYSMEDLHFPSHT